MQLVIALDSFQLSRVLYKNDYYLVRFAKESVLGLVVAKLCTVLGLQSKLKLA